MLAALAFAQASAAQPGERAPFLVVLGIAQDGGYPQTGCTGECCAPAWADPARRRQVSSLGVVDPQSRQRWIIDATPDFKQQLHMLDGVLAVPDTPGLAGILLTHGHIGHYTGLLMLGHESMGATAVPVYAMPRMREFLSNNGPWDQLVRFGNIELRPLSAGGRLQLNRRISVTPFRVPHREEYTEVVGFRIDGPRRSALFIPDIDKWQRWSRRIEDLITEVDVAYLDGTFYGAGELPGRDMAEIPHPYISETMARLAGLPAAERRKVRFIHLNHSNPALHPGSQAQQAILSKGFGLAAELEQSPL